jgi:hypothetical protein
MMPAVITDGAEGIVGKQQAARAAADRSSCVRFAEVNASDAVRFFPGRRI